MEVRPPLLAENPDRYREKAEGDLNTANGVKHLCWSPGCDPVVYADYKASLVLLLYTIVGRAYLHERPKNTKFLVTIPMMKTSMEMSR